MNMYSFVISVFIIVISVEECYLKKTPKIAVIGGGIGGTSASFFLHELFGPDGAHIDLFERHEIGGRLSTIEVNDRDYEVGGSIIHERNKYMVDFLKILGLNKRQSESYRLGIYDGSEFVFTESDWDILNIAKLAWRYGYGPLKLQSYIGDMLKDFERIYTLQSNGKSFLSVLDLLNAMNPRFTENMNITTKDEFKKIGFSDRIINELIAATLTANYGQSTNVHGFVGSVSVAGAGSELWAVDGGNKLIPKMILERSQATLINASVIEIALRPETEDFVVDFIHNVGTTKGNINSSLYDIVIIATPLTEDTHADIKFSNFPKNLTFPGKYHRTVCTIVYGKLNVTHFGFESEKDAVDEILTVKLGLPFNSIGKLSPIDYKPKEGDFDVWKVFSQVPLTKQQLGILFSELNNVDVIDWLAYPEYSSKLRCDEFILHRNLFHVNAIEWAASAMEMSVIGAKNVALLAYKSWNNIEENERMEKLKDEL